MLTKFFRILISGIRAKLALFTGSLITITILILSYTMVRQQTEILTESYQKQAAISKKYISLLVIELNNIARNLIQIEEFRRQMAEQQKALKVYQTAKTVSHEKKLNLGLFKTNLFGAMGTRTVHYIVDTYYSRYLNTNELILLEKRVRQQIGRDIGTPVSDPDWVALQNLARRMMGVEDTKKLIKFRSELDAKIALLLIPSHKKIIEDTGLEQKLFRIQTFPVTDLATTDKIEASFDTNLLSKESPLAPLGENAVLDESLRRVFPLLAEAPQRDMTTEATGVEWNGLTIQALYSPLFQRPNSTALAQSMIDARLKLAEYKNFHQKDAQIAAEIAVLYPKIKARLKKLRENKPPIPPYSDREFIGYYKNYTKLVQDREKALDFLPGKNAKDTIGDRGPESMRALREAAWEDSIMLRYETDEHEIGRYFTVVKERELVRKRWKLLRNWVSEARAENAPDALKRLYTNGQIARSRSEAEELLWELDSKPLFKGPEPAFAILILQDNLTGIMRTLVDHTEGLKLVKSNRDKILISAVIIGLGAIFLAVYISGLVVQKIKRIIRSAEEVGGGNLVVTFEHGGSDEFGTLTLALNKMVGGLNEREKIKGILGSMIDPVVVAEAMKDMQALKRGGEKNITAFFSDIASFSTISEKLSSPDLAALLNEYLSAMTIILKEHEGVLDKYIGDAIVGIYNSPIDVDDHAFKATMASIRMQAKLVDLRKEWILQKKFIPEAQAMKFRIGLNTGFAKVGFMGTDALASYTMMGDTVNLAARLEAAGKDYGVSILASDAVYDQIKDRIFTRRLDVVRVKGKHQPVTLYQVICPKGKENDRHADFVHRYEKGIAAYLEQAWDKAIGLFNEAQRVLNSSDKSSKLLIERCLSYKTVPPPADWDGVFTRTSK
jgi:adenylate cyclase